MSTRSVVARVGQHEGTFSGRYCHWNGSPTWTGPHLLKLLKKQFKGNLQKMLVELVDNHPVGWSVVGESCYCHPQKSKHAEHKKRKPETEPFRITERTISDSDAEWLYVIDVENNKLFIRDVKAKEDVGVVELTGQTPAKEIWVTVECGSELERCGHYAWAHGLLPRTSNLSTQTWLGNRPLEFRDAVGFIIDGERYASTGCGGNSDYFNHARATRFPRNTWISTVKKKNGKRVDLPVAVIAGNEYRPYPGVLWILPPTKNNPQETIVGARVSA